jgi:acyl carrier protein
MNDSDPEIESALKEIFHEVLEIPLTENIADLTMLETTKWDSLAQVLIISAIEARFELQISAKDFAQITSFKSAILTLTDLLTSD